MKPTFYFSLFTLIALAAGAFFNARPAQAQTGIELENVEASYQFGEQITFVATLKASIPIQSVSIIISDESQTINRIEPRGPSGSSKLPGGTRHGSHRGKSPFGVGIGIYTTSEL